MLKGRVRGALVSVVMALALMGLLSGCQLLEKNEGIADAQTEEETETEIAVQAEADSGEETEFESDVVYVSEDGSVRIILPDSSWQATQDNEEMRVFTSGDAAMISIVHADGEASMENISVMQSRDELVESLTGQYPEEDAFEVLSYEKRSSSTVRCYEYVVKYTYPTSMWTYSVTYGILAAEEEAAYVVSGTVTDDDKVLLEKVQTSVESFSVLDTDSVFSVLPGTVKNNEGETENESEEMASLQEYAEPVKLYVADDANVRERPSMDAEVVAELKKGDEVSVIAETSNWFMVRLDDISGYVNKAFLVDSAGLKKLQEAETETETDSYTLYAVSDVNLRSEPSTESNIAGGLSAGTAVTVLGESGNWYLVSVNGTTGYVSKDYFTSAQSGSSQSADASYYDYDYSYDNSYDDYSDNNYNYEDDYSYTQAENGYTYTDTGENYGYYDYTGDTGSNDGTVYSSSTGMISGTVTNVDGSAVAVQGSNGDTYYIDYSDAGNLEVGSWVNATVDYAEETASGGLYASSVD